MKNIGIWQPIFTFMAILSILTNVFQLSLVSEAIPKLLYRSDNDGSISGYAESKLNNISVSLLEKHGLDTSSAKAKYNASTITDCL